MLANLRRAMVEDHIAARATVAPVAAANELELLKGCLRAAASRGQAVDPGVFEIAPVRHEPSEGLALELSQVHEIASTIPERIKRLVPFWKGVPLARAEVQLLREQLLARPTGTRLVFRNEKRGVYTKGGFRSIWLPALLAADLAHEHTNAAGRTIIVADFRFHWLRHTAISLMARAGMKPELIAERVGHRDDGGLIYRRYRHLFPSEVRAAVGLLDAFISNENVAEVAEGSGQ